MKLLPYKFYSKKWEALGEAWGKHNFGLRAYNPEYDPASKDGLHSWYVADFVFTRRKEAILSCYDLTEEEYVAIAADLANLKKKV
jgi:hypothetical protein